MVRDSQGWHLAAAGEEMTHNELLAKINYDIEGNPYDEYMSALRSVVELHKPIEDHEHLCGGCWFGDGMMAYPCPTIQVIEKEFSNG
jgi:hypothetical protein